MKHTPPRVLAIDDDMLFLQILAAAVKHFGAEIRTTDQQQEFLELAARLTPDVCLIDLHLVGESGYDLIQKLRENDSRAAIIVISGTEEQSAVVQALEVGADDFILKPLDRRLLATKLRRFIMTPPLMELPSSSVVAPGGKVDGFATFDARVLEVDELGLHLISRNLIPKGVVIRIPQLELPDLKLPKSDFLLTIIRTELDVVSGKYQSYGEFDGVDAEFLQAIRGWIVARSG